VKCLFVLCTLYILPLSGIAQIPINCGGVNQVIPRFTNGFLKSSDTGPLFDKNVLKPITASPAEVEIRVLVSGSAETILVIKCVDNTIRADRYFTMVRTISESPKDVIANYENLGPYGQDTSRHLVVLCKRKTDIKPYPGTSWDQIFSSLIKNHLYDIPDQDVLDKIALHDNPKGSVLRECCGMSIELKVGNHCRYVRFLSDYSPTTGTAKYVKYKQNIYEILSPFFN
jgi:hypothetical protein